MRTIEQNQLDEVLGKSSFWNPTQLVGKITYLYGLPSFDAIILERPSDVPAPLNIKLRPNGIEILMMHGFKMRYAGIRFLDIKAIELEIPAQVIVQKDKSVLGRALLGGVLLGPVGAIVGGMSALQPSSTVQTSNILLTIQCIQDEKDYYLVGLITTKDQNEVTKFIQNNLSNKIAYHPSSNTYKD